MKLKFVVGPIYTNYQVLDATAPEIAELAGIIRMATQARPDGYQFMPKFRQGVWDGYINLSKGSTFPTGLLSLVQNSLPKGLPYEVEDNLQYPQYYASAMHPNMFQDIELRPYQINAAIELIMAKRGIAHMATNSGKTEVISAMCKCLLCDVLVLTTKLDLLHQTRQRLAQRLGEVVGIIGDGQVEMQRVTVGMLQTLAKRKSYKTMDIGCLIFDECHHVPAKTAQAVMLGIPAPMRFGLSGTPLRNAQLADLMLTAATGDVVVTVTNQILIESGISAKPQIVMLNITNLATYKLDWEESYQKCIVENEARNQLIVEQARLSLGVVLILVERIEHGRLLQTQIPNARFFSGDLSGDERLHALEQMRTGQLRIVIATPIFDEGVDVPSIDTLILAGGGLSPIKLMQRLGRGMRHKAGANVLHVVDFIDDTNQYLMAHSIQRTLLYEQEGFDVQLA